MISYNTMSIKGKSGSYKIGGSPIGSVMFHFGVGGTRAESVRQADVSPNWFRSVPFRCWRKICLPGRDIDVSGGDTFSLEILSYRTGNTKRTVCFHLSCRLLMPISTHNIIIAKIQSTARR